MSKLLLFHAFRRNAAADIVEVLTVGPRPSPDVNCTTQRNERELDINPPHVYAYLGKTVPEFGNAAFAIGDGTIKGDISPFDTGGLVDHIHPVRDWPRNDRRAFLRANTWPSGRLHAQLERYPGTAVHEIAAYLDGERPSQPGPSAVFANPPPASTWSDARNIWPAWTWELRVANILALSAADLVNWTCPAAMFNDVYEELLRSNHADAGTLLGKYIEGGVSRMVERLRAVQV